jgi:(p)ppGpp synthase/HD superfamily hydrolase
MTRKSPDRDTTIEDIHATRRRIAEKFGHDLAAIVEDAKKRQAASGHEIWRPQPKSPARPESTSQ